jgi:hypothetical protein
MTGKTTTFGPGPTRTLFAALYGDFSPGTPSPVDARRLFLARSAAMGWLMPTGSGAPGGLWGTSEVATGFARGAPGSCVARFRVALTPLASGAAPPVQPFLACAGDTMARLGRLRLEEVQVLLPERDGAPAARSLVNSGEWFGQGDLAVSVPVRVTLDGGPDPAVRAAAAAIDRSVRSVRQHAFEPVSHSLADEDHLILWAAPLDRNRAVVAHHRVTFSGCLAEWSLDAVGWLAAVFADAATRCGVTTPLMFSASRAGACTSDLTDLAQPAASAAA